MTHRPGPGWPLCALVCALLLMVGGPAAVGQSFPIAPPACQNGQDDDGDGRFDYPRDPGCLSASDKTEAREVIAPFASVVIGFSAAGAATSFTPAPGTGARVTATARREGVTARAWRTAPTRSVSPLATGVLRRTRGQEIAHMTLQPFVLIDGTWLRADRVRTSATGAFTVRGPEGRGRRIVVVFAGDGELRGAIADIDARIRGSVSLTVTRARVNGVRLFRLTGRARPVTPRHIVVIQVKRNGRWRSFARVGTTRHGRFQSAYRPPRLPPRAPGDGCAFRVVVPAAKGVEQNVSAVRRARFFRAAPPLRPGGAVGCGG